MDKTLRNIIGLVLFVVSFGLMGYFAFNGNNQNSPNDTVVRIDSTEFIDTVRYYDTIPTPRYIPIPYDVYDTIPYYDTIPIDTNEVLKDYYRRRPYNDTVVNDSNLLVVIVDTIYRNKIYSRTPFVVNNYKEITIEKIKNIYVIPDNQYYIGAYAGTAGLGGEVMYQRKLNVFGIGGGTNGFYFKYARRLKKR